MVNLNSYVQNTSIGSIYASELEGKIVQIILPNTVLKYNPISEAIIELNKFQDSQNTLLTELFNELDEYFSGKRKKFDMPLLIEGTEFQKKVWAEVQKIPYGETRTYKEISIKIGKPNSARGVGRALNTNKIPIIIPCHRVIGTNGKLTGYAGGLEMKKKLLDLERMNK